MFLIHINTRTQTNCFVGKSIKFICKILILCVCVWENGDRSSSELNIITDVAKKKKNLIKDKLSKQTNGKQTVWICILSLIAFTVSFQPKCHGVPFRPDKHLLCFSVFLLMLCFAVHSPAHSLYVLLFRFILTLVCVIFYTVHNKSLHSPLRIPDTKPFGIFTVAHKKSWRFISSFTFLAFGRHFYPESITYISFLQLGVETKG